MSKFSAAMNAAKDAARDRSAAVASAVDAPKAAARPIRHAAASRRAAPRRGRPAGKRSSETITQVTAYIESSTHVETKIRLLQNARNHGEKQDFSGLVQQLLTEWLKVQK